MRDFSISPTAMGTVYSAFTLGYAVFMIPDGHLADRIGARRTLALMGFGSAAFTGLSVLTGTSVVSAWLGILPGLTAIRFGLRVVTAPSILNTGALVGGFFAPVLTPIIASRFGWSWVCAQESWWSARASWPCTS